MVPLHRGRVDTEHRRVESKDLGTQMPRLPSRSPLHRPAQARRAMQAPGEEGRKPQHPGLGTTFWFGLGVSHSPGRGPLASAARIPSLRTLHSPLAAPAPLPFQLILFLDDEGLPSSHWGFYSSSWKDVTQKPASVL